MGFLELFLVLPPSELEVRLHPSGLRVMLSVEGSQSGLPPQLDWEDAMEQAPAQPHQICLVKAPRLLQLWQPGVRA